MTYGQQLGGKAGDRDERHAEVQWCVGLFVLNGVAGFVGGDAEGCQAGALVVVSTEGEPLMGRIVMIGQGAMALNNFHIVDPCALHHGLRRFASGDPPAGLDLDVFRVGPLDLHLCPDADEEWNSDKNKKRCHNLNG
jgi:hypothetical protein